MNKNYVYEKKMETIRIKLDFATGPLWPEYYNEEKDIESTGVDIVDNDKELKEISHEISSMFNSYYIIDEREGVSFNYKQERKDKDKMLSLLAHLNKRLEEINDGSFVVVDEETPRVRKLKPL